MTSNSVSLTKPMSQMSYRRVLRWSFLIIFTMACCCCQIGATWPLRRRWYEYLNVTWIHQSTAGRSYSYRTFLPQIPVPQFRISLHPFPKFWPALICSVYFVRRWSDNNKVCWGVMRRWCRWRWVALIGSALLLLILLSSSDNVYGSWRWTRLATE